jgi:hypothetical protein
MYTAKQNINSAIIRPRSSCNAPRLFTSGVTTRITDDAFNPHRLRPPHTHSAKLIRMRSAIRAADTDGRFASLVIIRAVVGSRAALPFGRSCERPTHHDTTGCATEDTQLAMTVLYSQGLGTVGHRR